MASITLTYLQGIIAGALPPQFNYYQIHNITPLCPIPPPPANVVRGRLAYTAECVILWIFMSFDLISIWPIET